MGDSAGSRGSFDWNGIVISVSFLYVHDNGQVFSKSLTLSANTDLKTAIFAADWLLLPEFNAIKSWLDGVTNDTLPNQKAWYVGVWSVKKPLNYVLQEGDRVEFYRPLSDDPMKQRQSKVQIAKKKQAQIDSIPKSKNNKNRINEI